MPSAPHESSAAEVHRSAALITCETESETMSIDLNVEHGTIALHKVMSRPTGDGVDKTVERMRMLFAPKPAKGAKGVKITREDILASCPVIKFFGRDGDEMHATSSTTNGEFWSVVTSIHIGIPSSDEVRPFAVVPVVYNHPMITSVSAPPALYVGHDASCFGFGCVFCSESELEHQWLVGEDRILCERRVFVPAAEHVGLAVRCRVRPKTLDGCNPQAWYEVVGVPTVQATPGTPIRDGMTKRWELTRISAFAKYCGSPQGGRAGGETEGPYMRDALRIVSYNILNDAFATTNWARNVLYPFTSEEVRSMGFRQGAILNELRSYNAELMCLQEVGESMYRKYLGPMLTESGFGHFYAAKSGMVRDGCAIVYSTRRFECVSSFKLPLTLTTLRADHPELSEELRTHHPHLEYDLSKVVSVGAYTVLKDFGGGAVQGARLPGTKPERYIIVGNTHLFYKPDGCHIRAIQALMHASVLHKEYTKLVDSLASEGSDLRVHLVCSGDFNFTPVTGAYKLLTSGSIPDTNDCWDKGGKFWWGQEAEEKREKRRVNGEEQMPDGDCGEEDSAVGGEEMVGTPKRNTGGAAEVGTPRAHCCTTSTSTPAHLPPLPASSMFAELVQPVGPPPNIFRKDLVLPGGLVFDDTHKGSGTLFTNYSLSFKEVIDHVFIATPRTPSSSHQSEQRDDKAKRCAERIVTLGVVPLPCEPELQADIAIPSSTFPSDHLAIVAEVDSWDSLWQILINGDWILFWRGNMESFGTLIQSLVTIGLFVMVHMSLIESLMHIPRESKKKITQFVVGCLFTIGVLDGRFILRLVAILCDIYLCFVLVVREDIRDLRLAVPVLCASLVMEIIWAQ